MFPKFAPDFGLTLSPATTQVLDWFAPDFGFSSFPFQTHVLDEFTPDFGLISLPLKTHVFDWVAPDLGLSSCPLQVQFDGRDILFAMPLPLCLQGSKYWHAAHPSANWIVDGEYHGYQ